MRPAKWRLLALEFRRKMATTHTFFATDVDFRSVLDWLQSAGATWVSGSEEAVSYDSEQQFVLLFPALGELHFWPDSIDLSRYPENSNRWRSAVLTKLHQQEQPNLRQVDSDTSPVAGLQPPYIRDGRFWISGRVWFPTTNLRTRFPELGRICARFQRWLARNPVVSDNGRSKKPCDSNLCMSSIWQRVYAFPEAEALLKSGAHMVDAMVSPRSYEQFLIALRLRGENV